MGKALEILKPNLQSLSVDQFLTKIKMGFPLSGSYVATQLRIYRSLA